jgi:hypothetical protein
MVLKVARTRDGSFYPVLLNALRDEDEEHLEAFKKWYNLVEKYKRSYPSLKSFSNERNIAYFTYLNYPISIQRLIYSTNWIE